jgi:hypothetical protein
MSKAINEITKLAKQLAAKESTSQDVETSAELLEALGSVAKMLEARAGVDTQVLELAKQVQELVEHKKS